MKQTWKNRKFMEKHVDKIMNFHGETQVDNGICIYRYICVYYNILYKQGFQQQKGGEPRSLG